MADFKDFYINSDTLANATAVFTDQQMITLAPDGYYSDGISNRYQTSSGLGPSVSCPECNIDCDRDVVFSLTESSGSLRATVTTGNNIGAIRVVLNGVGSRPAGVNLVFGGIYYNYFSTAIGSNYPTQVAAPISTETGYFSAIGGTANCGAWTNLGNNAFPIFYYNPNLDVWYNSGTTTVSSYTNQINPPIMQYTAGTLVVYIPKTTLGPASVDVQLDLPCGPGPLLTIGCPTTLQSITTSPIKTSHVLACGETASRSNYIGPVRSTTPGVLYIKDWIFEDSNGSSFLPNGYYKAAGASLNGVDPANDGSFRVEDGIVTEIQTC
tara:strand:+ start:5574 stop:6545 length:972 start_codon:yes stop_codon:yes gene_type:complete